MSKCVLIVFADVRGEHAKLWGDVSWRVEWRLKLIAESDSGERREEDVITIEREDLISPATAELTIAEGKSILMRHCQNPYDCGRYPY